MAEVLIPPLDEESLVLKRQLPDAPELGSVETARKGEIYGSSQSFATLSPFRTCT
jgi:hypothetical protein